MCNDRPAREKRCLILDISEKKGGLAVFWLLQQRPIGCDTALYILFRVVGRMFVR